MRCCADVLGSRRVVFRVLRERLGHDEAIATHTNVELSPTAPVLGLSVRARVPFTGTEDLQPGGFDDQVDRASVKAAERREFHPLVAPRERSVIRGVEVQLHQAEERCQEALCLPERQAEDDSQSQSRDDREDGVARLASATAGWR